MTVHVDLHIRLEEIDLQTADGLQKQYVLKAKANGVEQTTVFNNPLDCLKQASNLITRWTSILDTMYKDTKRKLISHRITKK